MEINIIGNSYTQDKTIRKYILLKENKNYSEKAFQYYLKLTKQFLEDCDFFDKVKITYKDIDNTRNVTIYVKEGFLWKTGANLHSVMAGRNNLFGKGYNARIRIGEEQYLSINKVYVSGMSAYILHKKETKRYEAENGFWQDYSYHIFKASLSYMLRLNEFYSLKWYYQKKFNFFRKSEIELISNISTSPTSDENIYISEFLIDTRDSKKTAMNGVYVELGDKLIYPYKKNIFFFDSYNYLKATANLYFMLHFSGKKIDKLLPQYYWQNLDSIFLYHFFNIKKKLYRSYLGLNIEPRFRWYETEYYFLENKLFFDLCYSSEITDNDKIEYSAIGTGIRLHIKKLFITDVSVDISHCRNNFSVYWKIGKRW